MNVDGAELARCADAPVVLGLAGRQGRGPIQVPQGADMSVEPDLGEDPDIAFDVSVERLHARPEIVGGVVEVRRQPPRRETGVDLGVAGVIAAGADAEVFRAGHPAVDRQGGI